MEGSLSMQGSMNQICHYVREKEANRASEYQTAVPYLILNYLQEHGYANTASTLNEEAALTSKIQVCDNIDLEMILDEYMSYHFLRFRKYPTLWKRVDPNVNVTENKTKSSSTIKQKRNEPVKEKRVEQRANDGSTSDINLAVTVTPILSNEDKNAALPERKKLDQLRGRSMQSKISQCIERLYPADSEFRKIAEELSSDIVVSNLNVHWDDLIGLQESKAAVIEAAVFPLKYPTFFARQFKPWKSILLFGPPGTGKTMLAKAVATECDCTFFNITASSLVSKWRGDSEKYIRVLFDLAYNHAPTIIFIDEIDWIATGTDKNLSEPAKRFRSELLARLDGLTSTENSNIVLIAATNAPWNIDAALLRRLERKIHISLPNDENRLKLLKLYVSKEILENKQNQTEILSDTKSYSYADMQLACKQAWILQIRPMLEKLEKGEISIVNLKYELTDYEILENVLKEVQPTCNDESEYKNWGTPTKLSQNSSGSNYSHSNYLNDRRYA